MNALKFEIDGPDPDGLYYAYATRPINGLWVKDEDPVLKCKDKNKLNNALTVYSIFGLQDTIKQAFDKHGIIY